MQRLCLAFILAGLIASTNPIDAAIPETLTIQAILEDGSGNILLTPPDSVRVSLYDDTGTEADWEELFTPTSSNHTFDKGVFSAVLGTDSGNPLSVLDFNQALEVGIKVDTHSEQSPRIALTAVPYALAAKSVSVSSKGAVSITSDSDDSGDEDITLKTGSDTRVTVDGATGNVGIGTASPAEPIDVAKAGTNAQGGLAIHLYNDQATYAPNIKFHKSHSDILGTNAATPDGTTLAQLNFYGRNSSNAVSHGAYLQIAQDGSASTQLPAEFQFWTSDGTTMSQKMVISKAGNVGIGTASPGQKLEVAGNVVPSADNSYTLGLASKRWSSVWAANGAIQTSDRRLKQAIRDLDYGLDEIVALRPISYRWKDRPQQGTKLGLVAQELQQVVAEAVHVGDDERQTLGVSYATLVPVLIKAVQEQQQLIEQQRALLQQGRASHLATQAAVHSLERQVAGLTAALRQVETQLAAQSTADIVAGLE